MSQNSGWSDDGVTLLGRSFEKTEHVFARVGLGFVVLFACSVLSLGVVGVVVESDSPVGVVGMVAAAAFVGLFVATTGLGLTCLGFGCWSYWQSRRVRTTLDTSVQTPLRNPVWLVFVLFSSRDTLNEYEWWVQRAWRWSLFGLVWLVPVTRLMVNKLG